MKRVISLLTCFALLPFITGAAFPFSFWKSSASTAFVTGMTPGTDTTANNGYWLGKQIDVQGVPITITHIDVYVTAGSTGTHTLAVFGTITGTPVQLGSTSLNFTGLSGWQSVAIGTPVVASASTTYAVAGDFTTGTDHTLNDDTVLTHTAVANIPNAVYWSGSGTFGVHGSTNNCYVPMGFRYHL